MTNEEFLLEAERRFKEFAELEEDLSVYPMHQAVSNITTNKAKSKEFSEVFTPLWLVDQMIDQVQFESAKITTLDLCAGYGQFSIRLMRKFYENFADFNAAKFLKQTHAFSELQLSSCFKLFNIFGVDINLFIGDSTYLNKLPTNATGIWLYVEEYGYWVRVTETIKKILQPRGRQKPTSGFKAKKLQKLQKFEDTFVAKVSALTKSLNVLYTTMKENTMLTLSQVKAHPKLRLEAIHQLNMGMNGLSLQSVDTPVSIVSEMLDKVDDLEGKSILALFNCEIVEQLIHKKKVDPSQITFGIDFGGKLKAQAMQKMYGVDIALFKDSFLFIHQSFKGRKFDVCFSNPPYNDNVDLKIVQTLIGNGNPIAKEFVIVHPAIWLIDIKGKDTLYNSFKAVTSGKIKSVKVFNGNKTFGVYLFVPCVITHIDMNHVGGIDVEYFEEKYSVAETSEITKFGKAWLSIVKPFYAMISKKILVTDHVWNHNVSHLPVNNDKYYCQLACIRANVSKNPDQLINDDFYTMCVNDATTNKGIRKSNVNRPKSDRIPTFEFDSESEVNNFLSYLNTDFARFCLSIFKVNAHLDRGEMTMIPWLDFTQSWDDDKLFAHFDINQETQDYIRKFLPDYYGIRK